MNKTIFIDVPKFRLRVRKLDEHQLAAQVAQEARDSGAWQFQVFHGGTVANAYGYSALTEAALIVANPLGETVVWMAKLPANKVTKGGAAGKVFPEARAIWDGRYSDETQTKARKFLQEQHRVHFAQTVYERLLQDSF